MSKRAPQFKRVERDWYPTPEVAATPLFPHLPEAFYFWEPCAGDGALIGHIERGTGGRAVGAMDICPMADGIREGDALQSAAPTIAGLIICNTPWTRSILHPMIEHFSDMRPTWLLFDADWMHTKQSAPYLPRLRKIVSVGRVKWIKDSPHTGKDNCAWMLFDKPSDEPAQFFGRVV